MNFLRFSRTIHIFIFLLGVFYFAVIATDGTFDFLRRSKFDNIFDYQFLSLVQFRLDIKPSILGVEGFIDEQGRAFTYFGILPALLRLPLWFALDLTEHATGRGFIFVEGILCAVVAQSLLVRIVERLKYAEVIELRVSATGVSLIWFCSPLPVLVASPSFYHEAILLSVLLALVLIWLVFVDADSKRFGRRGPLLLAVVVALSIHTRIPVAIGCCLALAGIYIVDAATIAARIGKYEFTPKDALRSIQPYVFGSLLVIVSLALYLYLNFLKWGDPFNPAPVERYVAFQEGKVPERFNVLFSEGRFVLRRVVPNLLENLFPNSFLHQKMLNLFGLEYVRREAPAVSILLVWWTWLLCGVAGAIGVIRAPWRAPSHQTLRHLVLLAGLLATAVLMLSNSAITFRYKSELWLVLFAGSMCYLQSGAKFVQRLFVQPWLFSLLFVAMFLSAILLLLYIVEYKYDPWFNNTDENSVFVQLINGIRG